VYPSLNPTAGIDGTGGGGGGAGGDPAAPGALNGADGGDGIVAIRYFSAANSTDIRGLIRYNSEIKGVEIFDGHNWLADNLEINFGGHNLVRYSQEINNWDNSSNTITANATTAPDRTQTAERIQVASDGLTYQTGIGYVAGETYVLSMWIKSVSGASGTHGVNFYDGQHNRTTVPVTGDWTRVSVTHVANATYSGNVYCADDRSSLASINDVYIWGVQLEKGVYGPGPYTVTVNANAPTPTVLDGYRYHVYRTVGTSGFTPAITGEVEVLVVAGGGAGGGGDVGAGGGGGGVIYRKSYPVNWGTKYVVTVGAGGVGVANSSAVGGNGANSSFDKLVAIGGGGAAGWGRGYGSAGGSGGGSTYNAASGTYALPGIRGQGSTGGKFGYPSPDYPQPGGGGAGGPGSAADSGSRRAGDGGFGVYIPEFASIGGDPAGWFGGGGGGAVESGQTANRGIGIGGLGGGGDGGRQNTTLVAQSGIANTGGGGGGEDPRVGANGGSGIVAIRYRVY
jgi:hypothetical protein